MLSLSAALPILVILLLMLIVGWSAARAGAVGLAIAIILALSVFDIGSHLDSISQLEIFFGIFAEASFTRFSQDPRLLAILIAWFFSLFIEGVAGFGTAAALAAPILVSAGFKAIDAVGIVLVGHAVGVSFGAVGTPILPQEVATGFDGIQLAGSTALYHLIFGSFMALAMMQLINRAETENPFHSSISNTPRFWIWILVAAFSFLVPFYLIAYFLGPELPTLGGALIGCTLFIVIWNKYKPKGIIGSDTPIAKVAIFEAATPYLILLGVVTLTRLYPPISNWLQDVLVQWQLTGQFSGSIQPLYHPGTMLFLSLVFTMFLQRIPVNDCVDIFKKVVRQLGNASLALILMLTLSRLLVHAGMIDSLASAASGGFGIVWPLLAPFIGVLGTFITGSATTSNILFTDLQFATAVELELNPLSILGAQSFGAAAGNIICPHNIIAAGAAVNLTLLGGLLTWFIA